MHVLLVMDVVLTWCAMNLCVHVVAISTSQCSATARWSLVHHWHRTPSY